MSRRWSGTSPQRLTPYLLLAITVSGGLLRLYQIGDKGLWLDEAFSVWMGGQPLGQMFGWLLKIDQHPPLYYALLHVWLAFGDDAATVRTLSALLSTLTIPVIYLLGKRLGGRQLGLLAAIILALAPFHVRFAQETRMYALLTLNASLAMLFLTRLLTDPQAATGPIGAQFQHFYRTWRQAPHQALEPPSDFRTDLGWLTAPTERRHPPLQTITTDLAWAGYIIFTTATLLSHNTAIFFPLATNLFIFGLIIFRHFISPAPLPPYSPAPLRLPSLRNWLMAQAGILLLWSPWLAAFIIQSSGVYQEFWIPSPTPERVWWTLKNLLNPFLPQQFTWGNTVWGLYGLLALLGIWHFRNRPAIIGLLLTLFLTPIIGELLVSIRRPLFYDRTLIWITIPLYLLLAAGINQLRYRSFILAAVLMLVTINGLSLREYYTHFEKEQWDDAARYVAEQVEGEDLIVFNATWVQIPFDFYFRYYNKNVAERGAPVDLFDRGILEPKMTLADVPRLQSLLRQHERVWLVYSHNWYTDPQNIVVNTLSEELTLLDQRRFFGLEIHLYGTP